MSLDLLLGVREKLLRADKHLYDINQEIARYVVTESYGIDGQFEAHIPEKSGRPGITWRARLNPPPPLAVAVLCGDLLHTLRSALDHLAWALVRVAGNEPRDDHPATQFPIYDDRLNEKGKIRRIKIEGGISATAAALLEALQPYNRVDDPTAHPLSILQHLSNIDKHRTLNVAAVDLGKVTFRFIKSGRTGWTRAAPFVDGALIYWVLTDNPTYDPSDVDVYPEYSPNVAFRDFGPPASHVTVPVDECLSELLEFVRESVVQAFARSCFGGVLDFPRPIF